MSRIGCLYNRRLDGVAVAAAADSDARRSAFFVPVSGADVAADGRHSISANQQLPVAMLSADSDDDVSWNAGWRRRRGEFSVHESVATLADLSLSCRSDGSAGTVHGGGYLSVTLFSTFACMSDECSRQLFRKIQSSAYDIRSPETTHYRDLRERATILKLFLELQFLSLYVIC